MRRELTIAALAAMLLAVGTPARGQSPNIQFQVQPKLQPRIQIPNKPPTVMLIKPSVAIGNALRLMPDAKPLGIKLLPEGNYAVTLRRNNQLQRVMINGTTGAPL